MKIDVIGRDWLIEEIEKLDDSVDTQMPSTFNEENRYLPRSVTNVPGPLSYDLNPFMREPIDCFDVDSPVREVNMMKGVQITYTTMLESGLFYCMAKVKTAPMMYLSADKDLSLMRVENNILPMLNQSGYGHIIKSSDEGNARKTGKTKTQLQVDGGGVLYPNGANNANKMRATSVMYLLKDELDAWPEYVGKDGDPDKLTDARCNGFWEVRKIFRGSTPLILDTSKIYKQYMRGDKRKYFVRCKKCGYPQYLRFSGTNKKTGKKFGLEWDYKDGGTLDKSSVRYHCFNCYEPHYNHDKTKLFSEKNGAEWKPTGTPIAEGIRSYHLPALYSPDGMLPWSQCVADYLASYDHENSKVIDFKDYQVFMNNILGWPIEEQGGKLKFEIVSEHRRFAYKCGEIPNTFAEKYSGGPIEFLTCCVDVQGDFLAVAVFGWTKTFCSYVIDYWHWKDDDCSVSSSVVWQQLRDLIDEKKYVDDTGAKEYEINLTFVDSNGSYNDLVCNFCDQYSSGVYPILGAPTIAKNQRVNEFGEFKTKIGTKGYRIVVDHFKNRLAPVLRREWQMENGEQNQYHFNAPMDIEDKFLKELTVEVKKKKVDPQTGKSSYIWYRPGNARNELWDLLNYGHCSVQVLAYQWCIEVWEMENIDWEYFWKFLEQHPLHTPLNYV